MVDLVHQAIFQGIVTCIGAVTTAGAAVLYFKYVRLERPAVGVFNMRDIGVLLLFIISLPFLYLLLPPLGLTIWLVLSFTGAMYFGLRPLMRPRYVWPIIAVLLGGGILITYTLLGLEIGWQLYWVVGNTVMLIVAVSVANLYVQGGMRLRYIAWFALILAAYDILTVDVFPLSLRLADLFIGRPLNPAIGFKMGIYSSDIGLGDLLVYACFAIAAYKGFGRRGLIASFIIIPIFGAILPAVIPLAIRALIRDGIGIVAPAQASFGPAAFVTYWLLSRRAQERSMAEWFKAQAAMGHRVISSMRPAPRPAPAAPRSPKQPALADVQGSD